MSSTTPAGEQWPPPAFSRGKFTTGSCLILAAILSLMVILVLISFHLYTRYRREYIPAVQFYQSFPSPRPTPLIQGLSSAAIAALPIFVYRRQQSGGAEDCAVCLSSPEDGDPVRVLPDCKHVFHAGCIDAWLQSHSTCPVCRAEARPGVVRFEFGVMLASPRLPERVSGAGEVELPAVGGGKEGSSELRDLERQ